MTNEQLYSLNELKEMPDGTVFYSAPEHTVYDEIHNGLPKVIVKSTFKETGEPTMIIGDEPAFWPNPENDDEGSHDMKFFKVMGVIE